jgi:hypothetical protein
MTQSITQKQNAAAVITNSKRKFNSNTHTYIHVRTPKIDYIQNQYLLVHHQMNHYDTTSLQTKKMTNKGQRQSTEQTNHSHPSNYNNSPTTISDSSSNSSKQSKQSKHSKQTS